MFPFFDGRLKRAPDTGVLWVSFGCVAGFDKLLKYLVGVIHCLIAPVGLSHPKTIT
jgi:hypothetical protein